MLFGEEIRMLYMAQAGYQPSDIIARAVSFEELTGIKVNLSFVEYEDQYNLIIASSGEDRALYDIILVDLIWTADFAEKGIIDPVPDYLVGEVKKGIIPEIYTAFIYKDNLWAVPFLANFQLFYTNMDLLHRSGFHDPPSSLEEVVKMASAAKAKGVIKYPLFDSFRKQEALVCEYVWLAGAFGGSLVDKTGKIRLTTEPNLKALGFLIDLLNNGLMNPYSLNSEEVFAAEVFLSGDCLFTTNWTFLTGLIKESPLPISTSGKASLIPVSTETLPGVRGPGPGGNTSTISGYQGLSVASNSAHKRNAWEFINHLSSPEFQEMHLDEMSVWKEVWLAEATRIKDPDIDLKKKQIIGVYNRPIHPQYRKISSSLQTWLHQALLGNVTATEALHNAQTEIDQLIGLD
jgi:multiple sugar transport system substrate-binding protein